MRYVAVPEFSSKLSSLSTDDLASIGRVILLFKNNSKETILIGDQQVFIDLLAENIYVAKNANFRIYFTFGNDKEGEYVLILDLGIDNIKPIEHKKYFSTNDPNTNPLTNPHKNMSIDPRRNMSIDPRRNMSIDPNRNMMIDPRRNMMIDPNRNMMVDPRRNNFYGGPYCYSTNLLQTGFVVRNSEKNILLFDLTASFKEFGVSTESGNINLFDLRNNWVGFLVKAERDVLLRFDTNSNWVGMIV